MDALDPEEANLEDDSALPSDKTIAHTGLVGDVPRKSNVVAGGKTLLCQLLVPMTNPLLPLFQYLPSWTKDLCRRLL